MLKKILVILICIAILPIFSNCKKRTENLLLGTWERVNIDDPFSKVYEYWHFIDSDELMIVSYDESFDSILRTDTLLYILPQRKEINIWYESQPESVRYFEIKKIQRKVLGLIENNGYVTSSSYEFIKNNDFLSAHF
ncbi:MAG: hypothetical protein KKD31_15950 [Bacteroidetes bacterium]|nr:hypothetical protein [Bacteroidota bacterium]